MLGDRIIHWFSHILSVQSFKVGQTSDQNISVGERQQKDKVDLANESAILLPLIL